MAYAQFTKPGAFRFCAACGSRNKAHRSSCAACGSDLAGTRSAPVPTAVFSHFARPGPQRRRTATLRWVAAAGVVLAVGAGLLVRGLFSTATLEAAGRPPETGVSAVARAEPAPDPAAALSYTPGWNPAAVRDEPAPVPSLEPTPYEAMEVLPPPPPPIGEPVGDSGMVGFTPRPVKRRPQAGRAFTNDDVAGAGGLSN